MERKEGKAVRAERTQEGQEGGAEKREAREKEVMTSASPCKILDPPLMLLKMITNRLISFIDRRQC